MDEKVSILDKTADDLTVRDSLKIHLVIVAAMVATPFVIGGAVCAAEKIRDRLAQRKLNKPALPDIPVE